MIFFRAWTSIVAALTIGAHSAAVAAAAEPAPDAIVRLLGKQDQALLRVGEKLVVDARSYCAANGYSAGMMVQRLALDIIDAALIDGQAKLTVVRNESQMSIELSAKPACRARFDVRAGRSNKATSDGIYVQVSSDLVAEARNDGELATILAHELAHSILRHPQRLRAEGDRPRVKDTEVEADRLSAYLLEAAGYPVADAISFWSRWGRRNDWGILSDGTHPGWKDRVRSIEREAAAIAAQRASGRSVRAPADLAPR